MASHAPRILEQIAQAAQALSERPVELLLSPEELGRVRMTMQTQDGAMVVNISAERPETLDILRRHIDQLATQLKDLGYDRLDIAFAHHEQADSSEGDRNRQDGRAQGPELTETTESENQPIRLDLAVDGRLDIRL